MRTGLFESIPPHALLHLINCLHRRTYRQGEFLYTQSDTGKSLFLIQKGICAIRVDKDDQTHRDLKPENILVLHDGRVKILDFGLAAPPGEEDLVGDGTLYYASPEQIEGEPEDARSDIYAVGIMAFELLCGKRPYPENDLAGLMELRRHQAIPDPADTIPDLPETLRQFILTCCAIDPAKRYASAEEALLAIEKLTPKLQIQTEDDKRMLTSVLMVYQEKDRQALRRLLEKFSKEAEGLGIVLKSSETMDI